MTGIIIPRSPSPRRTRDGFALVSVLWILVGVSALALAANLAARQAVAAARNRADGAAAGWLAEGCLERARAALTDALLAAGDQPPGRTVWGSMDDVVAESPATAGCGIEMIPAGAALDVNAADGESLRRLLLALGTPPPSADSLADALLDWRDADSVPRPFGAEAGWYRAAGRAPPRNAALADVREIRRVRGWERIARVEAVLGTEPGRVPVSHAPAPVLASLPAFGPEAVARVEAMRMRGDRAGELAELIGGLSPGAREAAMARYPELTGRVVMEPEAWIVRARAGAGTPPAVRVVEVRLVRAGPRAAIVRRKTWSE